MTCWNVKRRSNDYVDGRLRTRERYRVDAHLRECGECEVLIADLRSLRSSLGNLPRPVVPESLRMRLLVTASQERQLLMESNGSRLLRAWNYWTFRLHELMRPLTIPATGGVLSSVLLFGALALTISTATRQVGYEVPVMYGDRGDANLVPVELRSNVVLTLSLDEKGHVTEYAMRDEAGGALAGSGGHLQFSIIPLPQFPSVLALAQPTSEDIRISFKPLVFRH